MPELVINVSNIISPLCYTVLRVEPYNICPFRCIYCYSRWYIDEKKDVVEPRGVALRFFKMVCRAVYRRGLRPIPFRLSTLVDPFPPHEELYRFSEKILKIALEYDQPLVINTKSVKAIEIRDIRKLVEELLDNGLAVLQISISTLDDVKAEKIEPFASPPGKRLEIVKMFGECGYPVSIRLSPYIPFYSPMLEKDIEDTMTFFKDMGVRHVILESLRIEREYIDRFVRELGIDSSSFESYSLREVDGLKPIVRISKEVRIKIYATLYRYATKTGIGFATCKEGLFRFHTTDDCCGAYMLKNYILRATFWDIYRTGINPIEQEIDEELYRSICKRFSRLCGEELGIYPKMISKPMKYHERKMLRLLRKHEVIKHIAPDLIKAT
jgi:DNA repair photolyase